MNWISPQRSRHESDVILARRARACRYGLFGGAGQSLSLLLPALSAGAGRLRARLLLHQLLRGGLRAQLLPATAVSTLQRLPAVLLIARSRGRGRRHARLSRASICSQSAGFLHGRLRAAQFRRIGDRTLNFRSPVPLSGCVLSRQTPRRFFPFQPHDHLQHVFGNWNLLSAGVMNRNDGAGSLGRYGVQLVADNPIFHEKPVVASLADANSDGDRVRVRQRLAESRLGCRQDRANACLVLVFEPAHLPEVFEAGIFEVAEVNDVIDMLVGVHIAPHDRLFNDYREPLEKRLVHEFCRSSSLRKFRASSTVPTIAPGTRPAASSCRSSMRSSKSGDCSSLRRSRAERLPSRTWWASIWCAMKKRVRSVIKPSNADNPAATWSWRSIPFPTSCSKAASRNSSS